ncbi:MAG: restriction endonuclease [Bacteroidales bacterium]|nr:restriction endonuclease [Bacteroidales bacterium]
MKNIQIPKQKGQELEDAVHAIEQHIFKTQPGLREADIIFERNKILYLKGAKNEIDLFAQANFGKDLNVTFIFECKNWNKKVGKNEIIIFSEKVSEINAQKGFFMAKSFTRDAVSRAKNDGRIDLVKVNTEITINSFPIKFFVTTINSVGFIIKADGIQDGQQIPMGTLVHLDGVLISMQDFTIKLRNETQAEMDRDSTLVLKEHEFKKEKKFDFESKDLKLGDKKVKGIKCILDCKVESITPVVKSQYNVNNRGRHVTILFKDTKNNLELQSSMTQLS